MEKKEIKIIPYVFHGTPKGQIKMKFILIWDDTLKRHITINAPYLNWSTRAHWDKMKKIMTILIHRSGHSTSMTKSEFINFQLGNFRNMNIKDYIWFEEKSQE